MEARPSTSDSDTRLSSLDEDIPPTLPTRPRHSQSNGQGSLDGVEVFSLSPTVSPRGSGLRPNARHNVTQNTIRAVTPDQTELAHDGTHASTTSFPTVVRAIESFSPHTSPRSVPMTTAGDGGARDVGAEALLQGGGNRRQGMVFNDVVASSFDSTSSSPPPRNSPFRPRTHTLDGAVRQQPTSISSETRHRINSFSSTSSVPLADDPRAQQLQAPIESLGYPSVIPTRSSDQQIGAGAPWREKKSSSRRLIKRTSSRQTSPLRSSTPSVDALPSPIPTDDTNKLLLLMKTLCGRMRGPAEYQTDPDGPWYTGNCLIEEDRGSLVFDTGDGGPYHVTIVPDLRGCRVTPVEWADKEKRCLEILHTQLNVELLMRPLVAEEFDMWLAALLCWQQVRPNSVHLSNGRSPAPSISVRLDPKRRGSAAVAKEASVIKVGKVMLWDKGSTTSPRAIVRRPSTRDLRSNASSWRRVSCILQDSGELTLLTENDVTTLAIIDLTQLSRCAIQQLDRSVLDEEYCLAIFPMYASTSTQLSIFRPIYVALDSRVLFEVWFVLLRAFAMPDIYALNIPNGDQIVEVTDLTAAVSDDMFRVEKMINLRVTEAKFRARNPHQDGLSHDRHSKGEADPLVGNYLAEVVLDGEVRARTTTKSETKSPFWREEYDFCDMPSTAPFLSVLLKRVEGNWESLSHQVQASLGLPRTGNLTEIACGSVDVPLANLERGKDHEQWLQVYDERQQPVGTMLVKVRHEELVVLMSKEYQPLSELLHKFTNGLTTSLPDAIPGGLRRLAEILLNIFQVSERTTDWLMNLVEEEIDGYGSQPAVKGVPRFSKRLKSNDSVDSASDREQVVRDMSKSLAGEANLLFRGNTLLTQALEFHMRRLGKDYLEETLSEKIFEINEINPDCEVDPSKIQHGDDIGKHWNQLIHLTTEVWECIAASASRLPPELRHILKYIRAVAEDRYGNFLRTVTYTSVSGFLFLRFICPAILNPKLFGLLRDHPRPRAQRTLTLVAKGLQALANISTIGKKETWMEPMNRFLNVQRQPLKDFLDHVCAIPVDRASFVLSASYSTPITILGRLSPLAREGFPSLPYLIDHARNFAALVKLWNDAHPPGGKRDPLAYEGEMLEFAKLCRELQQRSNDCLGRIESLRAAEYASQPADELSDAMEHLTFLDMSVGPPGYSGSGGTMWLDHPDGGGRPPGSSGSEMDQQGGSGGGAFGRDRLGREATPLRHVSAGSSEMSSQGSGSGMMGPPGGGHGPGTIRSLRNGGNKQARKFFGGLMRRTASPEWASGPDGGPAPSVTSSPSTIRQRAREIQRNIAAAEQMARSASDGSGKRHR